MGAARTAIVVAGMHRSGTSAITRIVNLLGADLADDLIPAGIGNEHGHWESRAVQALHNELLAELASDIYSPLGIAPGWFDSAAARPWIDRAQALLATEYPHSPLFVIKDPRITLVLPLWRQALRESSIEPRFVLPFRSPGAVARSLEVRERRLASGRALPHAQGVAVWLRYVLAAEKHTRGAARSFVAFDDVLADWRATFARVGRQLGIAWPNEGRADDRIEAFLDRKPRDSDTGDAPDGVIDRVCRSVHAGLQQAVVDPDAVPPAFDAAAHAVAAAEDLLGAYVASTQRELDDVRERAEAGLRRHEDERVRMSERFDAELALRDARLAEATAHAERIEHSLERAAAHAGTLEQDRDKAADYATSLERDRDETIARLDVLERERGTAIDYAKSLEQERDTAVEYATSLEQERDTAVGYAASLEKERDAAVDYTASLEKERDTSIGYTTSLQHERDAAADVVASLARERDTAIEYATSLEHDRDRAVEYAGALKRSRDEAVRYAQSLERARSDAVQRGAPELLAHPPVFFTIVSRNYLAYALTLMQSVAEHHPDAPRYLILADREQGDPTLVDAPFTTIPADALALPDFDAFAFRYTIMEFNTAIKPYAFAELRRRHPGTGILYLDPDILVVEPLVEVEAAFANGALAVLTPHLLDPIHDDRHPGERAILGSGTYNCGFVAIGSHVEADRLIAWWADRLEFGAVSDIAAGLFTDQKWVDLVPGLFPDVHILRDEGYNLAYWNLSQRPVSRRGGRWYAAERPLAFVHFSGVDLDRPARFSKHQDRHTQATIGQLRPLYARYLALLEANGHAVHRAKPYAFGRFADGEPICDPVRAVYRRYFDKGASQAQRRPYSMDRRLYDLPCDELPDRSDAPITRLMYAVWSMRADVRKVFDIGRAEGRDGFIRWFVRAAGPEMGIPERHLEPVHRALAGRLAEGEHDRRDPKWRSAPGPLRRLGSASLDLINWSCRFRPVLRLYAAIPESTRHRMRHRLERMAFAARPASLPGSSEDDTPGINLVGYAHGEFGVAEILRRHAHTLQEGGMPFVVRNFDVGVASRQHDRSMRAFLSDTCRHDVNLFCINADQMPVAREHLGDAVFGGRYNIGCWFWELEKFPEPWHGAADLVDEIWVTSAFVRDAVAACTSKPVHIVPVALAVDVPADVSRAAFGLPDDAFVCLFSFDFNSFATRKNALGAIAAFRRAFADGRRGVRLIVKTTNGERHPDALRALIDAAGGDERIEVRDGFLDREAMWALQACCDVYVSLHRSEGLGLGMAECMLLGKPVVATAYSGNLAFMDADNSCLVGYTLVPVNEGEYPAWEGQHWAEPDLGEAAAHLRRLADDPDHARRVGERAQASAREHFSTQASLAAIEARLVDIRSQRAS